MNTKTIGNWISQQRLGDDYPFIPPECPHEAANDRELHLWILALAWALDSQNDIQQGRDPLYNAGYRDGILAVLDLMRHPREELAEQAGYAAAHIESNYPDMQDGNQATVISPCALVTRPQKKHKRPTNSPNRKEK